MRPSRAGLIVQHDVVGSDMIRVQDPIIFAKVVNVGKVFADEGAVNCAVDDGVGDVNILGAKLSCHRLRQSAKPVFGTGECREPCATTHAGGRAGEDDGAAFSRQHANSR